MDHAMIDYLVSKTLDNMGLSEDQIQWRRDMYLGMEVIRKHALIAVEVIPVTLYFTGSSVEGIGIRELKSDVDIMCRRMDIRVIAEIHDWALKSSEDFTVMMDTTNAHPGYVHLVLMSNTSNMFMRLHDDIYFNKIFFPSSDGKLLLLNGVIKFSDRFDYSPALAIKADISTNVDVDNVECLGCNRWPPVAQEWITRCRPSHCPSPELVECLRKMGCLLVSTAHRMSLNPNIEWRLSFSLIERELMWHWRINQLKCYVLLKLIKDVINNESMDKIHSYHMKTLMFWMTEETGYDWWESQTLMECFRCSLGRLLYCVENGMCPNYFIKANNMFDTFTLRSRKTITRVIQNVISKENDYLLQSNVFRKFYEMTKITILPSENIHSELYLENFIKYQRGSICVVMINSFLSSIVDRIKFPLDCDASTLIRSYSSIITQLQKQHRSEYVHFRKPLLKTLIMLLESCLASVWSSVCVNIPMCNTIKHMHVRAVQNMLLSSTTTDVTSGKLKLAVHFYRIGDKETVVDILNNIVECYTYSTCPTGHNISRGYNQRQSDIISNFSITSLSQDMNKFVALDSIFLLSEMVGVPSAMVYEVFKIKVKGSANLFESRFHKYRCTCVVDSIVLVHFLLFMCHYQLGHHAHCRVALDNLRWTTSNQAVICHKATALNLLGSCYMTVGDMRRATDCFVRSLGIKSSYSAAPLHLLTVLRKCFTSKHAAAGYNK